jgi:DNA-binding transcriptional LysR family regulator
MQSIDLNLLTALNVLLAEGSVTGAAERMNLSVPAMSRKLDRIRRMVNDPLFVRAGRGLVPTPRAEALRQGTREVVRQAQELLQRTEIFDFRSLRRTFTIRADDGAISSFAPQILRALQELAPLVTIRFTAQGQQDIVALREGHVDLDIGVIDDLGPEIVRQTLFKDRFVAVFRTGHPLKDRAKLTPKLFASYGHVTVSRRGLLSGPIDIELAKHGLSRRIQAVTPTLLEALAIARHTDLIASAADRLTQNAHEGMEIRDLPVKTPAVTLSQAWHPRFSADAGHQALRKLVHRVCQGATRVGSSGSG